MLQALGSMLRLQNGAAGRFPFQVLVGTSAGALSALRSGQIDAMTDVPFAQVPVVKGRKNLRIYTAQTGAWTPICMRIDVELITGRDPTRPFNIIAVVLRGRYEKRRTGS